VVPVANQTRGDLGEKCSSDSRQVIERTYRRQLEMINTAYRLGVQLGVGTDAGATGVLHGEGFYQEMALYQEAGLPLEAILQAATVNGAAILGKIEQFGMIATGHQATLLVVEGDPLTDISALKRIKYLVRPRPVAIQS
jgi:imidazolonepropionase-like amidohydrolase